MARNELAASAAERFNVSVEAILEIEDLSDEERQQVPAWWNELVEIPCADSIHRALGEWNRALPGSMRRLRHVLNEYCLDVSPVRMSADEHTGVALQYTFDAPDGREFLFGYAPEQTELSVVTKLPESVRRFYSDLHNGLHNEPVSEPVGIYKADKLIDWASWLGDSALHYLGPPPENPPLARDLAMFYTDGAGGYILANTDPQGTEAWTAGAGLLDEEPRALWDVVDDWLALVLTGDFID